MVGAGKMFTPSVGWHIDGSLFGDSKREDSCGVL